MATMLEERPSSGETRQRLDDLIAARQDYADYLRAVANGRQGDDPLERGRLKLRCDETMLAWRAAHDAWRLAASRRHGQSRTQHVN